MCTPVPQAAYAAVALGRRAGLDLLLMFGLYAAADVLALFILTAVLRRVPLPGLLRRLVDRAGHAAERKLSPRRRVAALFLTGYANLYAVGVLMGFGRVRLAPAFLAGLAGDLVQFTSTVVLGGFIARFLPIPGAEWSFLAGATIVAVGIPACLWLLRHALKLARLLVLRTLRTAAARG